MSDFEYLIRSMIKNGASTADITVQTINVLNAIDKEAKERKECNGRTDTLNRYKKQFEKSYKENNLDIADVAALAVIVCSKNFSKWGKKEMEQFFDVVSNHISDLAKIVGKNPGQVLSGLFSELSDAISSNAQSC